MLAAGAKGRARHWGWSRALVCLTLSGPWAQSPLTRALLLLCGGSPGSSPSPLTKALLLLCVWGLLAAPQQGRLCPPPSLTRTF